MPLNSLTPVFAMPCTRPEVVSTVQKSWLGEAEPAVRASCSSCAGPAARAQAAPRAAKKERRLLMVTPPSASHEWFRQIGDAGCLITDRSVDDISDSKGRCQRTKV